MKPSKTRLKPLQRRALYLASSLLWLSGALWLYYKYFGQVQGDYGMQAPAAQPILLEIHGAAAMAFLILLGTLLVDHVPLGWKHKEHRLSGVSLLSTAAVLILTGWGLYYIGSSSVRHWTSLVHWTLGLASAPILWMHVRLARRTGEKKINRGG